MKIANLAPGEPDKTLCTMPAGAARQKNMKKERKQLQQKAAQKCHENPNDNENCEPCARRARHKGAHDVNRGRTTEKYYKITQTMSADSPGFRLLLYMD